MRNPSAPPFGRVGTPTICLEATYEESKQKPHEEGIKGGEGLEATYEESKLDLEGAVLGRGGGVWKLPMRNPSSSGRSTPTARSGRLEATYEESKLHGI